MHFLLSGALVLSLLGTNTWATAWTRDDPVCVIGAGPAGLSAAHALESRGHKVVVFDRQAEVGGKCQAYYENGVFHPLGALLFTNVTYFNALDIIRRTNATAEVFGRNRRPGRRFEWTTGDVFLEPTPSPTFQAHLSSEIQRYVQWWELRFAPSFSSAGYKAPIPEALTVSTAQWLSQNNYSTLPVIFNQGMVAYGYGDIRQTPILYMLQYFAPDVVRAFAHMGPAYLIDFHEVFSQYAKNMIKSPILTNTTVSRVDRSGPLPILTYSDNSATTPTNRTCSGVIMAFPPTLSALRAAGLTLSANELEVFTPIEITEYFSGAVRLSEVPRRALYNALSTSPDVPPDAKGQPVAFMSLHETSNIATTWSWGALRANHTYQHAHNLLKTVLTRHNKDPQNPHASGIEVTDSDVKAFSKTDYFPHFGQKALAEGWYEKFYRLQGQQKTYWASGLNALDTVEFAVRAGLEIANSYFAIDTDVGSQEQTIL